MGSRKVKKGRKVRFVVGRGTTKEGVVEAVRRISTEAGLEWIPSKKKKGKKEKKTLT